MASSNAVNSAPIATQTFPAPAAGATPSTIAAVAAELSLEELLAIAAKKQQEQVLAAEARRRALDGNGKRFHTRIPNSTFIVNKGPYTVEILQFHDTELYTEDPDAIDQLLAIADKPGSLVYLRGPIEPPEEKAAHADVILRAERAHDKMLAGTKL